MLVCGIAKEISHNYFSPFCKSPTPFFQTRPWRGHKTRIVPVTLYPGVQRTAARTKASCSDLQVLILILKILKLIRQLINEVKQF